MTTVRLTRARRKTCILGRWPSASEGCLGNRDAQRVFAAVTAMDLEIGRLLDRRRERAARANPVVFTSDNGFSCGQHGFWGKGNGTYPPNMYENSAKSPCDQPAGAIEQGSCSEMVSAHDFMPTLLDYAGLPLPTGRNLPGRFCRCCAAKDSSDEVVVYDEHGGTRMLRTREWKYVIAIRMVPASSTI